MSVWAVISIPERPGFYLTGSADMTIKFWKEDIEMNSFAGWFLKLYLDFFLFCDNFLLKIVAKFLNLFLCA